MDVPPGKAASDHHDLVVLQTLMVLERRALIAVEAIACFGLLLWLIHFLGSGLPSEWLGMRLATALSLLLFCQCLRRTHPERSALDRGGAMVALGAIAVIATLSLGDELLHDRPMLHAAPNVRDLIPWPTALVLLFGALATMGMRVKRMPLIWLVDIAAVMLVACILMLMSGFLFGATGWFGTAGPPPTAPQTIIGLMLIGLIVAARRAVHGFEAVLVGVGIGSRIARLVLPYAIVLPFLLVLTRTAVANYGLLSEAYATGISVSLQALIFLCVVIWLARRINLLESELRHMSLADELTGIHNRRGFMVLAEQALHVARREALPLMLFYFDLDGLKRVNDTLGHDVGSELLRKVAEVLRESFREGDVVARLGGDEFVVLVIDHDLPAEQTLRRVEARAEAVRARDQLPYEIAFSAGCAEVDIQAEAALDKALQRADALMYEAKKARKAAREAAQ